MCDDKIVCHAGRIVKKPMRLEQEARRMSQDGRKPTTHAVYGAVRGNMAQKHAEAALKHLREMGLLGAGTAESETAAVPQD